MTHTAKHTPLHKAAKAISMLYAEAFAGSNNKEFVVELYTDARLLETAAPAMYVELVKQRDWLLHIKGQVQAPNSVMMGFDQSIKYINQVLAQAEGR